MKRTILKGVGATAAAAIAIGLGAPNLLAQQGGWGQDQKTKNQEQVRIGEDAPKFELEQADSGQKMKLEEHLNKKDAIILHFFAPKEMLDEQQQQQGSQRLGQQSGQSGQQGFGQRSGQGMGQDQGMGQQGSGSQMKPNEAIKKTARSLQGRQTVQFIGIALPKDTIKKSGSQQGRGGMGQSGTSGQQEQDVQLQGSAGDRQFGASADLDTSKKGQSAQIKQKAKQVAQELQYPVLVDEKGEIAQKYGITELPHAVVIDNQGKVCFSAGGEQLIGRAGLTGQPTNYLEQAVQQVLQGRRVEHPYGASTVPASAPRQGQQPDEQPPLGGQQGGQQDDPFQGQQPKDDQGGSSDPFGGEGGDY